VISIAFGGRPAWLCTHAHNWRESATLVPRARVDEDLGQTGREGRAPVDDALLCRLEWMATLSLAQLIALRNATQAGQAEPVLVPVWPLALPGDEWDATPHVDGSVLIAWQDDWSDYEIKVGEPITDAAEWDNVAPVLIGYLATIEPRALNDEESDVRLALEEDEELGSYPLLPDVAPVAPVAPALGAFAPAAFPWEVEWAQPLKSGHAAVRVTREEIGNGRRRLKIFHPQAPERPIEGTVQLDGAADVARLLTWWRARHGAADAHWVSTWISGGRLATDAAAGASELQLEPGAALGGNRYLALHRTDGSVEYAKVSEIAGNTLTLAAPLAAAVACQDTRLSLAILGRHAGDDISLRFVTPYAARVQLAWRELAAEYAVPAGETRGLTLGRKPAPARLYTFVEDYAGATVVHRATDWRVPLTHEGTTWLPRNIERGERKASLDLSEHSLELDAEWWDGCPFVHFLPGRLAARVFLTLHETTVVDGEPTELVQVWHGEVKSAPRSGLRVSVTVGGPNDLFSRRFPVDTFGQSDNADLFDARNGLARADWRFTAEITAVAGNVVTIGTIARAGGLPAGFGFAHWFAGGVLEWTAAGITRRVSIYDSTVLASGSMVLTLRAGLGLAAAMAVALYPGYDKRAESAKAWHAVDNPEGKFDAYGVFRGFPFVPNRAPQFKLPASKSGAAGKK